MWKSLMLDYRKQLHWQRNLGKGGKSGKGHAWIVGYDLEN
jgi:hypothetical protein